MSVNVQHVIGHPALAGRASSNKVCLFSLQSACPRVFWNWLISFFLKLCMVLEPHGMWRCAWQKPNFFKKNCSKNKKNGPKMGQKRTFLIFWKILSLIFSGFGLKWYSVLFVMLLHKSNILKKSSSWDMGQTALRQSDCRIP